MAYKINVGDPIPAFSTKDQDGETVSGADLIGGPLVLYFYPRDETPGCTKEACQFRDNMERLTELEVLVIGVSPDNSDSHQKFIQNHDLNFTLVSDENLELCKALDVLRDQKEGDKITQKFERTTFVIDPEGFVYWIERPVNVEGHVDRVMKAVKELLLSL